jgi:tol-pal system protein YbgF
LTIFSGACYGLLSMSRALTLVLLALVVTGCATRASYQRLTTEVATLRSQVTDLRQSQDAASRDLAQATADVRALEARLAEASATQAAAANEVATLRARVDKAETELREARTHAVAATPPAATPPRAAPRPSASAPPQRPAAAAPAREGAEQAYQAAMKTFHAREYGQAVLDLVDFMAKYPKHPLVANAQYWIGEAYYVQHDYRQAMAEFQKVLDVAPNSAKVPDALLKIGYCYRNMQDESRARQTWDRVAKDYPKSPAGGKAQALLRSKARTAGR